MHRSFWLLLPLAVGCSTDAGIIEVGDTDAAGNPDEDFSEYDGATLRIVQPSSGSFLELESPHEFQAEIVAPDGTVLDYQEVAWTSSESEEWAPTGLRFTEDQMVVGLHDITASVELPNGDRLAHTVGGVLVQSKYAGTYAGLFSADVTADYNGSPITVTCSGAAVIVVDPYGEKGVGDSECLLSLMGFDLPATFLFDLDNDSGDLSGTASADLGGFFELPFEASGTLDPDEATLEIGFAGDLMGMGAMEASVGTERISLDAGLED